MNFASTDTLDYVNLSCFKSPALAPAHDVGGPKYRENRNVGTNALSPTRLSSTGRRKFPMNLLCENYAKTMPERTRQNSKPDPSHDVRCPAYTILSDFE